MFTDSKNLLIGTQNAFLQRRRFAFKNPPLPVCKPDSVHFGMAKAPADKSVVTIFNVQDIQIALAQTNLATTQELILDCSNADLSDLKSILNARCAIPKITIKVKTAQQLEEVLPFLKSLQPSSPPPTKPLIKTLDLSEAELAGTTLSNLEFDELSLPNAKFDGATLINCSFEKTDMFNAHFHQTVLKGVLFHSALMGGADFFQARIGSSPKITSFTGATLSNSRFNEATFFNLEFNGANLENSNFTGAIFKTKGEFNYANLIRAIFDGVTLEGDFEGTRFGETSFKAATLTPKFNSYTVLKDIDFTGATLLWDLREFLKETTIPLSSRQIRDGQISWHDAQELTDESRDPWDSVIFERCKFNQAQIRQITAPIVAPVPERFRFLQSMGNGEIPYFNLSPGSRRPSLKLRFDSCNFENAQCPNLYLSGTQFIECDAQNANFSGGQLDCAQFISSDLRKVMFSKCSLGNTDFGDSDIDQALFQECFMGNTHQRHCKGSPIFLNVKAFGRHLLPGV